MLIVLRQFYFGDMKQFTESKLVWETEVLEENRPQCKWRAGN
jgi:hypothetical protein